MLPQRRDCLPEPSGLEYMNSSKPPLEACCMLVEGSKCLREAGRLPCYKVPSGEKRRFLFQRRGSSHSLSARQGLG